MPNWTSNTLITDNPALAALLKEVWASPERLLLSRTVPMPEPLKDINLGSVQIDGVVVHEWRRDAEGRPVAIDAVELVALLEEYGTASWYDWSVACWGTKWDADIESIDERDDGTVQVWFDTAWSPPTTWLTRTVEMFPQGRTELAFAEGGVAFWGSVVYQDGVEAASTYSESFWNGDDLGEVDDIRDALHPDCRAHLDKYSLHTGG